MKTFDWEKARKICERPEVIRALGGLEEDWGYTSDIIYENGVFYGKKKHGKNGRFFDNSYWATPIIEYETSDGEFKWTECYIDDGDEASPAEKAEGRFIAWLSGGGK